MNSTPRVLKGAFYNFESCATRLTRSGFELKMRRSEVSGAIQIRAQISKLNQVHQHSKLKFREDAQRKANVRRNWQAERSVFALAQTRGLRGEWHPASGPQQEMVAALVPALVPPFQSSPLFQSDCGLNRHANFAGGARSPDSRFRIQEAGLPPTADPIAAPTEIGLPPKDR